MAIDTFIEQKELQKKLKTIENTGEDLSRELQLLLQYIKHIVSQIKYYKHQEDAKDYFDILQDIHYTLSVLYFKEEIGLPDKLRKFVHAFERLDDEEHRDYYFNMIKRGEYLF